MAIDRAQSTCYGSDQYKSPASNCRGLNDCGVRRPLFALWIAAVLSVCLTCGIGTSVFAGESEIIRVMTFNLWIGGEAGKQPLEQTAAVIRAAQADVVGLQETDGFERDGNPRPDRAMELARILGWNCFLQGEGTAVISRFKIISNTPRKWGVELRTDSNQAFWLFNAHFPAAPYQPYQLLSIPYHDAPFLKTEDEAIQAAKAARGRPAQRMVDEIRQIADRDLPVFVTGDFNEPSHHDWTKAAVDKKLCPISVNWPTTRSVETLGFRDGWRAIHPDPLKSPGVTWTPITLPSDPMDKHDRIDFVFYRGKGVKAAQAHVVGEAKEFAQIVVTPYPSDHRAVVVEMQIEGMEK